MASTFPVAAAPAVDSPQQNSFHPSWMHSAFNGGGNGAANHETKASADHSVAAPVFVKNRYGREDMLALMGDAAGYPTPEGLQNCPFYVEEALQPIVCYPLSDLEQRLQKNINSSKAMASLSHAERANVATGVAFDSSNDDGSTDHKSKSGSWTSVKQWNRNHPTTPATRASAVPRAYATSGRNYARGDANRGRGALTPARGGFVSGTAFNLRAQGLYDPCDPKDRPRQCMSSTSDEGDAIGERSWKSSPSEKQGWSSHYDAVSSISEHPDEFLGKSESGTMPEWMEDGEDQDKEESGDDITSTTGSFDEHGRFQKKHHVFVDPGEEKALKVSRDRCEEQQSTNITNYSIVSGIVKSVASQQIHRESISSSSQTPVLNSEAKASSGYSNVLSQAKAVGYHLSVPSQQNVGASSIVASSAIHQGTPQFFYLDPTKQERGPFEKIQMDSWYKRGYFTEGLEVRLYTETKYRTLGELIQLNGQLTPFDFKDEVPSHLSAAAVFSNPAPSLAALFASGTGTMWNELGNPGSMILNQTGYDAIAVERKRIEDEQRRILEEQAKMREYQKTLIMEMQKQKEEHEKDLKKQRLELEEHQKEIERRERELKESAEETKVRLELERLALAEKARELAEERAEKIQQNLKEARKGEGKQATESEIRQLEEELEKQRKIEESLKQQQKAERERNEYAEQPTHLLATANADKIRIQQGEQQRKQRIAENAQKNAAAHSSNEKEKRRESGKTFEIEEAWQSAPKPSQAFQLTEGSGVSSPQMLKSNSTKVAPWSTACSITSTKEKSLKEIQEEEERILRAEQAQQVRLRKEQESVNLQSSGTWSNASQRLQWNQPTQQSYTIKTNVKPAWGGVGVEQQKASCSPMWDGPSLQAANKVATTPKKATTATAKPKTKSPLVSSSSTNLLSSEKAVKRALGMSEDNNVFRNWVVQRLKQLNSTFEADVLAIFIDGIENPKEVEDYVVGYLGDSKAVKEFVREFLQKRSDFRNRGEHAVKDDLSSARGAPVSGNGPGCFSVVQNKKKKNKGTRLIVDGSCLGFRATSDPNRVNQGEIETVALTPGHKR